MLEKHVLFYSLIPDTFPVKQHIIPENLIIILHYSFSQQYNLMHDMIITLIVYVRKELSINVNLTCSIVASDSQCNLVVHHLVVLEDSKSDGLSMEVSILLLIDLLKLGSDILNFPISTRYILGYSL